MPCKVCQQIQKNLVYCLSCEAELCSACRVEYLCPDCNQVEQDFCTKAFSFVRVQSILVQLKEKIESRDFQRILNMITAWNEGDIKTGDKILTSLKWDFRPCYRPVFEQIEASVVAGEDIPRNFTIPSHPYRYPK